VHLNAAVCYTKADSIKVMKLLEQGKKLSKDKNIILFYARQLMGVPYVAQTLEVNKQEQLIVNLRQLDCTTYVENVLALTLCTENKKLPTFADFCYYLQMLRYEGGKVDYPTRLHYFTAWISDNTKLGFVHEIQANSAPFTKVQTVNVDYMSQHIDNYPMLKAHPEWIQAISKMEQQLTGKKFHYIPKAQIADNSLYRKTIKDGDIIAIITSKKGLDTSHIGIAVWHKDGLHMLNASQIRHKVVEEPMPLRTYMSKHPMQIGIRIVRIGKNK
jgi:xylanase